MILGKSERSRTERTHTRLSLKPLSVTPRDLLLFGSLLGLGVLTTEQVSALHFTSNNRARRRLRRLWEQGLIKRHMRPVRMGEGSKQFAYTLTRKGMRAVRTHESGSAPSHQQPRTRMNEHTLAINDLRVALTVAVRKTADIDLNEWRGDRTMKFPVRVTAADDSTVQVIIPDGFFVATVRHRKFGYFVEADRGFADMKRMRAKFAAYIGLWNTGFAEQMGVRSFRVLVITTSERRLSSMLATLKGLNQGERRDIISVSCHSRFSLQQPDLLFTAIWQTIDQFGDIRPVSPLPSLGDVVLPTAPGNPPVHRPDSRAS